MKALLSAAVIYYCLFPASNAGLAQGLAFESKTIAVGNGPSSVVAADLNNDGQVELICTDSKDNALTVLTNDGSGGFVSNVTYSVTGTNPACVLVADLTASGKADLVVAIFNNSNGNGKLEVLTNDGVGGFNSNATYDVGTGPSCVVSADVNGDGQPDLIAANTSPYPNGGLTVMTNDGGVFSLEATLRIGATISDDDSHWVAAADINGDGKVDLISANMLANTLTVFTNNGSGGFGSNATYNVGFDPQCVLETDVNGDGKLDLISANYGRGSASGGTLTVLTNDGNSILVSNATYNVGPGAFFVAAVDINGHGKPDLVCANSSTNTLTVLTNDGSGGFDFCTNLTVGYGPRSIAVTNVNGDGRLTLISANFNDNTLTVLTQKPPAPELTIASVGSEAVSVSWSLSATNFVLQTNADLATTNWGPADYAISSNGSMESVTVNPTPTGNLYFRLMSQ